MSSLVMNETFQDIVKGIEFRNLSNDELPIMEYYIESNNGIAFSKKTDAISL